MTDIHDGSPNPDLPLTPSTEAPVPMPDPTPAGGEDQSGPGLEAAAASEPASTRADLSADEGGALGLTLQIVSEVERRIDVEIPWEEVKGKMDVAFRELSKGISLKGFRKGKVPRKMLEQLFGKHVNKEVSQLLVQDSIERAVKKLDLKVVGEPRLELPEDGLVNEQSFKYSATLEIIPELVIKDYSGITVETEVHPVTEEQVAAALEKKRRDETDYRTVEGRPMQAGDILLMDVMGLLGTEPVSFEKATVELGRAETDPVPGLGQALIGRSPDETEVNLVLEVPSTDGGAAKEARLLISLHSVEYRVVPELDDEFAKDTGEADTLDGLKAVLRKRLHEEAVTQAREEGRRMIVREVIKRNNVPVAPTLVDRYIDQRLRFQRLIMGGNADVAQPGEDAMRELLRADATEVVRSGQVLEAIARAEGITVTDEEVNEDLSRVAAERGQNLARVRADYEKDGRLDSVRRRRLENRTLDLLASKNQITLRDAPAPGPDAPPSASQAPGEPA